jgi:hypothetical protein
VSGAQSPSSSSERCGPRFRAAPGCRRAPGDEAGATRSQFLLRGVRGQQPW